MTALYNATVELDCANLVTASPPPTSTAPSRRTARARTTPGAATTSWSGGAVAGRRIFGTFPTLVRGGPDDAGSGGQWIPTTSVDQYAATLASWFGAAAEVNTIFPNLARFASANLGFMG